MGKGSKKSPQLIPKAKLNDVKNLAKTQHVKFSDKALESARNDFEWGKNDILKAISLLKADQFHKSMPAVDYPGERFDVYTGIVNYEEIYTKFFIDSKSGQLIIDSFKLK